MGGPPDPGARVTVMAFGLTDPGKVRQNNEDAFLIAPLATAAVSATPFKAMTLDATENAVLLAVSDGMGGADAGEVASALVIESLRNAMMDAKGVGWDEATKSAVKSANRQVWSAAHEPGKRGMGATLTAVCVHAGHAYIAEVGDSRAYLVRGGRIRQMTRDQSFIQLLLDSGALKPEQAASYPMKNVVLQAMGQKPDVEVALGRLELRRGDRLLLCSDGLSNKLSGEEMREVIEVAPTLAAACNELIELANARGGDDNITVVLAKLEGGALVVPDENESMTKTFQVLAEYRAEAAAAGLGDADDEAEEPAQAIPAPLPISEAPPPPPPAIEAPAIETTATRPTMPPARVEAARGARASMSTLAVIVGVALALGFLLFYIVLRR